MPTSSHGSAVSPSPSPSPSPPRKRDPAINPEDYRVKFKPALFFYQFLLHAAWPLSVPFDMAIRGRDATVRQLLWPGRHIASMRRFGVLYSFTGQFLQSIGMIAGVVLVFGVIAPNRRSRFYAELVIAAMMVKLRSLGIAFRYGFMHRAALREAFIPIDTFKTKTVQEMHAFGRRAILDQLLISGWLTPRKEVIYQKLEESAIRLSLTRPWRDSQFKFATDEALRRFSDKYFGDAAQTVLARSKTGRLRKSVNNGLASLLTSTSASKRGLILSPTRKRTPGEGKPGAAVKNESRDGHQLQFADVMAALFLRESERRLRACSVGMRALISYLVFMAYAMVPFAVRSAMWPPEHHQQGLQAATTGPVNATSFAINANASALQSSDEAANVGETAFTVLTIVQLFIQATPVFTWLAVGSTAYHRRADLLCDLAKMIEPCEGGGGGGGAEREGLSPCSSAFLDITVSENLHLWATMRRIFLGAGLDFTRRVEALTSAVLALLAVQLLIVSITLLASLMRGEKVGTFVQGNRPIVSLFLGTVALSGISIVYIFMIALKAAQSNRSTDFAIAAIHRAKWAIHQAIGRLDDLDEAATSLGDDHVGDNHDDDDELVRGSGDGETEEKEHQKSEVVVVAEGTSAPVLPQSASSLLSRGKRRVTEAAVDVVPGAAGPPAEADQQQGESQSSYYHQNLLSPLRRRHGRRSYSSSVGHSRTFAVGRAVGRRGREELVEERARAQRAAATAKMTRMTDRLVACAAVLESDQDVEPVRIVGLRASYHLLAVAGTVISSTTLIFAQFVIFHYE